MNPPIKRKIIGFAKELKASFTFTTPVTTANIGPISEVTGIGIGSVIHHSKQNSHDIQNSL